MKARHQWKITTESSRGTRAGKPAQPGKTKVIKNPTEEPFIQTAAESRARDPIARKQKPQETRMQPVHVEVTHPSARKVCIAGTFNNWNTTEMARLDGGKWAIDLTLPPGAHEYRLVVDGQWMPDPNASRTVPNPFGEPNSLLIVPE